MEHGDRSWQAGGRATDLEDLRRDLRRVRSILSQRQRRKARWITITALTALLYSAFAIAWATCTLTRLSLMPCLVLLGSPDSYPVLFQIDIRWVLQTSDTMLHRAPHLHLQLDAAAVRQQEAGHEGRGVAHKGGKVAQVHARVRLAVASGRIGDAQP